MSVLDKALYYQDEWATIYCGNNREILPELSGIDLVVTSPPYDDLREYGGHSFEFSRVPSLLYNAISDGGVCIWVVGDQTVKGSETGSSFRQALSFIENGFNLHDTMIYQKINYIPLTHNRYEQEFEYMFVLSKGSPKTFNPIKKRNKLANGKYNTSRPRDYDGHSIRHNTNRDLVYKQEGIKGNIFPYIVGAGSEKTNHPATFPKQLVSDHIISWSKPNDLILDPFLGSGTTCYCAKKLNRRSIGIEINEKYCEIAKQRLAQSVMVL